MEVLFMIQVGATLAMTGLIWFVQVVHYPLFKRVGGQDFVRYEMDHTRLTTWVVAPLMLLEVLTAVSLLFARPATLGILEVWLGLGLLLVIWSSTAFVQVPLHRRLTVGFDTAALDSLVRSNWIRTWSWTARSVLVLHMFGTGW